MTELGGRYVSHGEAGVTPGSGIAAMKCPYCDGEIVDIGSLYSFAQAEPIVVVLCPHCRKILGIVNHFCED